MLRAAGPKQVKVILVQFINPEDDEAIALSVFYYFPNNKKNEFDICQQWFDMDYPAQINPKICLNK